MNRTLFALFLFVLIAFGAGGPRRAAASGDTIPMWSYTVTSSRDGKAYTGTMVGASPFTNPNSTTSIPTQIVPLIIHMSDGGIFDPTAPDPCLAAPLTGTSDLAVVQQSPIFQDHPYTMNGINVGTTQYLDAFQRANFWSLVDGQSYHTLLNGTTLNPITLTMFGNTIPPGTSGRCGNLGVIDYASFDSLLRSTLLPALAAQGVNPTTFPIFLLSNVALCRVGACRTRGYHSAVGSPPQTYAVADFDTTGGYGELLPGHGDIAELAYQVGEWMNDPLGTSRTGCWTGIGDYGALEGQLKVGAPLSGRNFPVTMPNGYAYHLPELAFFSWFFGAPSLGAGGLFSNNGGLRGNARLSGCAGTYPNVRGDLDGDTKSDLIWRQNQTGDVAVWLMNGATVKQNPVVASGVPLVWQIAGVGHLDGNFSADLVWRQTQTGDVSVWLMNGVRVTQESIVASGIPLAWQIVGMGDVDGDGKVDLVWRQSQTGDVAVWLMDGATVKQGPVVAPGVPLAWQIAGVGDLDGDGKADLVWRHSQTGDVAVWLMDGATVKQGPVVAPGVPLAWQIAGVDDVNGDGKADLVWRQSQTGDVAVWLMDGATVKQGPVIAPGVPLAWQIAGVGDADGDGKADLFWRQTQSGDVAVWLMDGVTVKQGPVIASGVPLAWQIQR